MSEEIKVTLMNYNDVLDLCDSLYQKLSKLKEMSTELESNTEITKSLFQANISEAIGIFINNYRGDLEKIQGLYDKELSRAKLRANGYKNKDEERKNGLY